MGQRPQPQQVHLEEPQRLHIILVPLDDRPARHRRILDRHQVMHRLMAQQKAARMNREVARRVLNLRRQRHQVLVHGELWIEPRCSELLRVQTAPVGDRLRQPVQRRLRHPQHLAHLPHRRLPPVANHVGHHRRPAPPIPLVDELDHLLPPRMHDVQIDVGRLGPLARQEPLKQQPHSHGIHRRDPQAETDRRVGCRTTPLAEDVAAPAEAHNLVHRQEVAAVVELLDQPQLPLELRRHRRRHRPLVPPGRTLCHPLPQRLCRGRPIGQLLRRIPVPDLIEREAAALRNPPRRRQRLRHIGIPLRHRMTAQQRMLRVGLRAARRLAQPPPMPDAGQHILQHAPLRRVVEHLGRRHKPQPVPRLQRPQPHLLLRLVRLPVARQPQVEVLPKGPAQLLHPAIQRAARPQRIEVERLLRRPLLHTAPQHQPLRRPDRHQLARMGTHLLAADRELPLRRPQPPRRDEPAELRIARTRPRQQQQPLAPLHRHLRPQHQRQP